MFDLRLMLPAARQLVGTALVLGLAVMGSGSRLWAQSGSGQDVPRIEPRFTRIFGTDSMEIGSATMSPDGRWIAFIASTDWGVGSNLWIVPTAGGEPARLTGGAHRDDGPVWFPGSDRIAFRSDRPGPWGIMTLPIDKESGRPTGPPRQVTLEPSQAYLDVSPDGKWIAYTPGNERGNRVIRIVPSTGGAARTVGEADATRPIWAPDGQSFYYAVLVSRTTGFGLVRVSLDGQTTDTVARGAGYPRLFTLGDNLYVTRKVDGNSRLGPTLWDLATLDGRSVARFSLPARTNPGLINRGNLVFPVGRGDVVTQIRILPVDGGPGRTLTEGSAEDEPLAWVSDGERVLFETALDGEDVLLFAPVGDGPMRQFQLPEDAWWVGPVQEIWTPGFTPVFSADGRHMLYAAGDPHSEARPSILKVLSLGDGRTWELSGAFHLTDAMGQRGNDFRDGEEFVYVEKRGDIYELRASPPEGPSRLVWSFGRDAPDEFDVHGDRILFAKHLEDVGTRLYTANVGQGEARELIRLDGSIGPTLWSPDGHWIATTYYGVGDSDTDDWGYNWGSRIMFLQVSQSGELVGEPRYVGDSMLAYWDNVWLPDSRGILAVGFDANVWLMPVDPDQSPVALTRDDPGLAWQFVLSPDGRHIAYSSRRVRGSSLWLVDLSEALQAGGS
jgi:Tol biopolymer transport system component